METRRKYRVAVVGGCGMWGRHYLRAYARHPDCEVIALVDRAKDRRQRFADHFGIRTIYDDIEELFSHDIPDIVSVILPVGQAPAVVIACAEAGVRVVSCEKPIAASLAEADRMVQTCRERGVAFGCGTACWELPNVLETAAWIRNGNIGRLTWAAIPDGLPREVSGAGCVQLTTLRALTGLEVEWAEGWELPPEPGWIVPPGESDADLDCGAYGRLGLTGGLVCDIPAPDTTGCRIHLRGENGEVWLGGPRSVLIHGTGASAAPVYPDWLLAGESKEFFTLVVERLMAAFDSGGEALCSGHDYRQSLEIAVALKRSARRGHERVLLPLEDRTLRVFPHPYRLQGGDVAGYASIGYAGPPDLPE